MVSQLCELYRGEGPELLTVRWILMQIVLSRPARRLPPADERH